jgi:predicted HAD superfamily Cof-like phosphohydrolase
MGQVVRKLHEELGELIHALGYARGAPIDFVEVVDALRDIEYLLHGVEIMCGVQAASDDSFLEVHWSNMTKQRTGVELIKPPGFKPPDIASVLCRIFPSHRLRFR